MVCATDCAVLMWTCSCLLVSLTTRMSKQTLVPYAVLGFQNTKSAQGARLGPEQRWAGQSCCRVVSDYSKDAMGYMHRDWKSSEASAADEMAYLTNQGRHACIFTISLNY